MIAVLIFAVLIVMSRYIRPVEHDPRGGGVLGASLAAGGLSVGHGLRPDERPVVEETAPVRFQLD